MASSPSLDRSPPRGYDQMTVAMPLDFASFDISAYACHMAALLGAHIIKIKLPGSHIEQDEARKVYESEGVDISTQAARVRHCMQAAFNGRRLVVFSGGAKKGADQILQDARDIRDGGGNGSIIGRNTFQRPRQEALEMLNRIIGIYLGKEAASD